MKTGININTLRSIGVGGRREHKIGAESKTTIRHQQMKKKMIRESPIVKMEGKFGGEANESAGPRHIPSVPLRRKTQTSFFAPVRKLRRFLGIGMEASSVHPFFPM